MKRFWILAAVGLVSSIGAYGQTQPKQHTETTKDTVKTVKNKSETAQDTSKRVIIGRDGKPVRTYKKK